MASPPKHFGRLNLPSLSMTGTRTRTWRVMVLGHQAVGKSGKMHYDIFISHLITHSLSSILKTFVCQKISS